MTVLNKDKILEAAKEYIVQGKFDKAIREYEKLLQADPKDMRVKLRIAELFAKRRQVPEAIKSYREVAAAYAQEGFYLKAVTVYKNILRLNPSLLDINLALAQLYEKMGLHVDAVHQYEILAQVYEQKNQFQEALKMREKLVELAPQEGGHRIRLAESYQREEKKEEAIEQYEILAKQYREQKKDPQRLVELYERILPYRPKNKEMLADLVRIHYNKKDYKAALKWLELSKQLVAADSDLLKMQAEMYAALNQIDTARGKYQELAELYQRGGESQKALEAYGEILVILPEETETLRKLVEDIDPDAFQSLLEKANRKRQQKAAEQAAQEEEVEKEKERKEQEREAKKQATQSTSPEVKPTIKPAMPAAPQKSMAPSAKSADPKQIEKWLHAAQSALSLAKAYQSTGLETEAKKEIDHAHIVLKQILAVDPNHPLANKLLGITGAKEVSSTPPKGKKKISFV